MANKVAKQNKRHRQRREDLKNELFLSERRMIVAKMYMEEDMTQAEIAIELGVSQGTISNDIKAILHEFQMRHSIPIQWHKEKQLRKLDRTEREAREAWERSIGKSVKVVKRTGADGSLIEKTETISELPGDPKFLNIILGCADRRIRILGLDEPQEIIINTMEGRLTKLIKEGKVTFDMLENDVGRQQAVKYFNLADIPVPDIIEGDIVNENDS